MCEGQFVAESAACFKGDAKLPLAVSEDGFHLRITFEASRHVAHRRARGPAAGHVTRLILVLAGLLELLPALHKTVGAAARIDAQFRFELERADGAIDSAASRLAGELCVLLVGSFGIVRTIGPHLLEGSAGFL